MPVRLEKLRSMVVTEPDMHVTLGQELLQGSPAPTVQVERAEGLPRSDLMARSELMGLGGGGGYGGGGDGLGGEGLGGGEGGG